MNGMGRLILFDEKSKNFPIRSAIHAVESKKPRSYSWSCKKTLDQGSDGACVGFAWTHELIARPAEIMSMTNQDAKELYFTAQKLDLWEGGAYPGAKVFYEGTAVLAGAKAAMTTGLIGGYRWAFSIEDLILGIGYHGPAVLGINWYEGMVNPDKNNFIKPTGKVLGGHAILCRSYNHTFKYFILRNSWGQNWGDAGDCKISVEDLKKLLNEDGEACFAIRRVEKKPV